jgi:hypothetical protein
MAMTVTATMSGTPANEHIYLWIRVLTNATETGGASVASLNAAGGASVTASLTPNFSGSLPCFALTADNWGGAYTAATSNTIDSGTNDPDDWGAGFGRYTGTVTSGTPLTFGASGVGGGCDYSTWACYEIPASGGTVTIDGSSPVVAAATGAGVKTVTSASFTPPAGSVVVAMVCGGGTGTSGTFTIAVTDTGGGLTWTKRAGNTTAADQNTAVFTATVTGGGGGGAAPVMARQPGSRQFRRRHHRAQMFVPAQAPQPSGVATLQGAGSLSIAATQAAGATLGGAGSVVASVAPPCITGIGGTGAGYFVDSNGNPKFVLGDAAWGLCGNAGRWNSGDWQADYDTYLANRSGQNFTVIYTKPMGTTQNAGINDDGRTFDPLFPFQGGTPSTGVSNANPSSGLTSAYWARIDYMLASALAKGITIFFNAIGYSSDFDSGPGPLAGKSTTEFTAYGAALGARYKNQPNLVWHLADDYFGDNDALITAFMTGVTGAGDTHAVSIENMAESTSRKTLDATQVATAWGAANAQYNFCYSYNVTYYGIEKAYAESSPIPVIQGDGYFYQGNSTYEGGSGAFAFDRAVRQDAWHAISSGARGIIHGSESIWQYASTALAASSTDWYYVHNAPNLRTIMEGLPGWHTLVPDSSSALVTAGRGTHASAFTSGGSGGQYEVKFTDSYVTASRTPDIGSGSTLAVIYLSHGTTITVDQSKMVSGYTATWVDPISGATSSATAGSSYSSTAKGNNSQGDPDWVLVLLGTAAVTVPGAAALGGAGSLTAGAAGRAPATLAGTGSIAAPATGASKATLNGTGSIGTPAVMQSAGATLAGTGSVTAPSVQSAGATLGGAASLTSTSAGQSAGATLAGAGSLNTPATAQSAGATLAGAGSLNTPATAQSAGATLAGAGSITGSGSTASGAGATLPGTGSLAALATQAAPATLAGAGSLATGAVQSSKIMLAGAGSIGTPAVMQGSGTQLGGAGALSTAGVQGAVASLAGAGSIGTPAAVQVAGATLAGAGSLAAIATAAGAVLAGAGSLTSGGSVSSPVTLAAAGSLSGSATGSAGATLAAAGLLSTAATISVAATLAGTGSIAGSGSTAGGSGAALSGTGSLAANESTGPAATLAAAGSLSIAATQLTKTTLAGAGSLTGAGAAAIPGAATLAGAGSLTELAQQQAIAILGGLGAITTRGTIGPTAVLAGRGSLLSAPPISAAAVLAGRGSLTAFGLSQAPIQPGRSTSTSVSEPMASLTAPVVQPMQAVAPTVTSTATSQPGVS